MFRNHISAPDAALRPGTVLALENITKKYDGRKILNGISLNIMKGECVALTGANGCGKSTLLRIAAGLTPPDAGSIALRKGVALQYVPDNFPALPVSGAALLRSFSGIDCDIPAELVRRFNMEEYLPQRISTYSRGMRSKLGALQALCASPGLLLLDEPISGQDADARAVFVDAVKALMAGGTAVLMACHERELADALATREVRIENGMLIDISASGCPDACLCEKCGLFRSGSCRGKCE